MGKKVFAFVAVMAVGLWGRPVHASTNCVQKFTFIARTWGPNPTFWIGEDLGGEAGVSQLLQVTMVGGKTMLIRTDLELQKDWGWFAAAMKRFPAEEPIELVNIEGKWRTKGVKWSVEAPATNEQLADAFRRHIHAGGDDGTTWNRKMGSKGVVPPVVDGFDVEMTYYYPAGFYVNYDIAKIYYFPRTGYLLVFTDQKQSAVGLDTMHGFMLLRKTK